MANAEADAASQQDVFKARPLPDRDTIVQDYLIKAELADYNNAINSMAPVVKALFAQLGSVTSSWNTRQGFWESTNFGEKIALIHSELSESLEAARKNLPSDHLPGFHGIEEELADAMIRIFDLAGKSNIRLGDAFIAKLLFNLTRPVKHGKAF